MSRITADFFYPERLNIKTGDIIAKEVDIIPNLQLNLNDKFVLVGDVRVEPPVVTISGNKKILDSITE